VVNVCSSALASTSGYIVPHSVIASPPGRVTMIGAATGTTQPGGIVAIDDETGAFQPILDRRRCATLLIPGRTTCTASMDGRGTITPKERSNGTRD